MLPAAHATTLSNGTKNPPQPNAVPPGWRPRLGGRGLAESPAGNSPASLGRRPGNNCSIILQALERGPAPPSARRGLQSPAGKPHLPFKPAPSPSSHSRGPGFNPWAESKGSGDVACRELGQRKPSSPSSWPRSSVVKEEEVKRARTRRLQSSQRGSEAPFPSLARTPLLLQAEFNLRQPCKSLRAPDSRFSPEHPRDSPLGGEPRATETKIPPRQLYPMGPGWPCCGAAASTQSCPRATRHAGPIAQPGRLHRPAGPPSLPATHPQPRCQPSFQASSWTQECRRIPPLNPCAAAQKAPQPAAPAPPLLPQRPCTHPASLLSPSRPRSCFRLLSFLLLSLFHGHS